MAEVATFSKISRAMVEYKCTYLLGEMRALRRWKRQRYNKLCVGSKYYNSLPSASTVVSWVANMQRFVILNDTI